jgi:gas vesicle protein
MKKFSNFLFGMIIGGIVGCVVGIIMAPSSGDKTRTDIQSRIDNVKTQIANSAKEKRIEMEEQLQNLREA